VRDLENKTNFLLFRGRFGVVCRFRIVDNVKLSALEGYPSIRRSIYSRFRFWKILHGLWLPLLGVRPLQQVDHLSNECIFPAVSLYNNDTVQKSVRFDEKAQTC
jgi:hypothetical protein